MNGRIQVSISSGEKKFHNKKNNQEEFLYILK